MLIDILGILEVIDYVHAPEIERMSFTLEISSSLIFGEVDPVIPTEDMSRIRGNYELGTILMIENASYYTLQDECVQQAVAGFIDDLVLSVTEKSCLLNSN